MKPSCWTTPALAILALTFISPRGGLAAAPNPMLHRSGTRYHLYAVLDLHAAPGG